LSAELLKSLGHFDVQHVPYKGSAPAISDLLAGQVPMMFSDMIAALPHIKAGKLRAIATTGAKRDPALPDLPTIAEAGVPGYEAGVWFGLTVPTGTPKEVVDRLTAESIKATKSPDFIKRMSELGYVILGTTAEQMTEMTQAELKRWPPVVRSSGASAD
nr:tripartite tricarboxylate transporter substrate-binding protein [Burkholderiaceae bacterium]